MHQKRLRHLMYLRLAQMWEAGYAALFMDSADTWS
jgi:hypothetical protein